MKRFTLIIALILGYIILPVHIAYGTTADSLQQQINNANSQIQAIDKQIKQYEDQLSKTSSQKNTLANLIKELNTTRSKLLKEKEQISKKITVTNLALQVISGDIKDKETDISESKSELKQMLKNLYQHDSISFAEHLLSTAKLADMSREYNNTIYLNESVRKNIQKINSQKDALNVTKNQKEDEQKNLTILQNTLTQKQKAVEVTQKEKNTLLTETKNQESNYKKLLAEQQKKRDTFEASLRSYESQLKFILNPKLLPTEGSGVLAWPLDNVFITQLFGKTVAAKRLYTSGSHSGVDFRASIGTSVKSMGNGIVIGTGDTDEYCKGASFGKWVFIKYDNGLSSAFGHLSVISATAGQKVSTGDIVALSGNTGHTTGPHLHVTVYASEGASVKTVPSLSCNGKTFTMPIAATNAYLDPMLYLPKTDSSKIKSDYAKD